VRRSDDFEDFYQASYGRTVSIVAAFTGSKAEAEDIAQEAYARALARWPRLRHYDVPEAWVRQVALRIAIDAGRRLRRLLHISARLAAEREVLGPQPGDDIRFTALGAALAAVPTRERQVLVLHYLADLPIDEIARECGVPEGTVKSRLAAGRRHLEGLLESEPEAVA
jgi:RNA polymerase sigma-70 factor, ECF subfamily